VSAEGYSSWIGFGISYSHDPIDISGLSDGLISPLAFDRFYILVLFVLESPCMTFSGTRTKLAITEKHHIRPMLVLFDSCWDSLPKLGP
jgi:hypothetical protein